MDLTNIDDLKTAMRLAGIVPRKGLGQHFLIDSPTLQSMLDAAEVGVQDTVLEIGPGLGVMTEMLTQNAARVVAVETDKTLAELLGRDKPDNLEIVADDILRYDLKRVGTSYKVVANLPYYITSKIIRLLLESPTPPTMMSLLVQKEVGERIAAEPGKLSILALSVQYYAEAEVVRLVERHKFWPAPDVDSAVLRIVRRSEPAFPADTSKLFRLIKAGFGERRKQVKNSLAGGLNCTVPVIEDALKVARIPVTLRAQDLSLQDWERLYRETITRQLLE